MLLGVDDTDSLSGGCTTHVAAMLVLRLRDELGLVLLDHPRLVRLNPSNPWKTRGNAALALRLGEPAGEPWSAGQWWGEPVEYYPGGRDVPPSEDVLDAAWAVVEELTWAEDGRTDPGLVAAALPFPRRWYDEALHALLDIEPCAARIRRSGALARASGSGRGLIGASAAMAWPGAPCTWELLAYRPRERWGTPRRVNPASVAAMDRAFATTFDSYDHVTGDLTMVPSSPCPVLYGIRGTQPEDLPAAMGEVVGEAPEGWLVLRTNQGTDDHLVPRPLAQVVPFESVATIGNVVEGPRTIEGGHVILRVEERGAYLDLAAYEPTKGFRGVVRKLRPGDRVLLCGTVRDDPPTLNLEKLRVISLGREEEVVKVGNPVCPTCGRAMKSAGTGAGYRCPLCRTRAGPEDAAVQRLRRELELGWYEVPTSARRHLARPLKLGLKPWLEDLEAHLTAPPVSREGLAEGGPAQGGPSTGPG